MKWFIMAIFLCLFYICTFFIFNKISSYTCIKYIDYFLLIHGFLEKIIQFLKLKNHKKKQEKEPFSNFKPFI